MKHYVLTGDWHIKSRYTFSSAALPSDDIFVQRTISAAKQVVDFAAEIKCPIVHTGDFFSDSSPDQASLFFGLRILHYAASKDVTIFMNSGNHDIEYENKIPSAITTLKSFFMNLSVADSRSSYTIFGDGIQNVRFCVIPYRKEEFFPDSLEELIKSGIPNPSVLLIHQDIKGVDVGKATMQSGFSEQEITKFSKLGIKLIINGHIHAPSINRRYDCPLLMPGSIYSENFSDEGIEKSFYYIQLDDDLDLKQDVIQVMIKNQIHFESILITNDTPKEMHFPTKNRYWRIKYMTENTAKAYYVADDLRKRGSVGVQLQPIGSHKADNAIAHERPKDMTISEWRNQFFKYKGYSLEAIEALAKEDEELFE